MPDNIHQESLRGTKSSVLFYRLLLTLGTLLLLVGFGSTAGSLMGQRLSGNALGNPFDFLFTASLLYLFPAVLIAVSLAKLESGFRVTTLGIVAITSFGAIVNIAGEVMKTNNYFVRADENVTKAFNGIEIIYQKRFNLIKNLDATSNKFFDHEQSVIRDIANARGAALNAPSDDEKLLAMGKFDSSLRNLVINIENYPNLKADSVILELMREIAVTERELLAKKNDFNNQVTEYNRSIRLMPYAITARIFDFRPRKFVDKESTAEIYNAGVLLSHQK